MEQKHMLEFARLQDEALARLCAGVSRKGYLSEFRAIAMPSFEDSLAYEILLPAGSSSVSSSNSMPAIAARMVWKRSIDAEKFRDPVVRLKHGFAPLQPTIEEAQVSIQLESVTNLLSKARVVTIPAYIWDHSLGIDGTNYELILGRRHVKARFKWWCNAPRGWEPLSELFSEIEALVENTVLAGS